MYLVKEIKTYTEIIEEGTAQQIPALRNRQYIKNLKNHSIRVFSLRKLDNIEQSYITFAVFPQNYRPPGELEHFEKIGNTYVNIRGKYNCAIKDATVVGFIKGWLLANDLIKAEPVVTKPDLQILNGKSKLIDVYGNYGTLLEFITDVASSLMEGNDVRTALRSRGYIVKK